MADIKLRGAEKALYGIGGLAAVIVLWQVAISTGLIDRGLTGSPLGAMDTAQRLLGSGEIWPDIRATMSTLATGLLFALLIGAPLSVILGRWQAGWAAVELPILILNATPTVALVIPIIMIVGIGPESKSVLSFFGAIIPILVSGRAGAASVPESYIRAAQVYGATRLQVFFKVVLPIRCWLCSAARVLASVVL